MKVDYTYYDNADSSIYSIPNVDSCHEIPKPEAVKTICISSLYNDINGNVIDYIGLAILLNVKTVNIRGGLVKKLSAKWLPRNIQHLSMVSTNIGDIDNDMEFRRVLTNLDLLVFDSCLSNKIDIKLLHLKLPTYMKHITLSQFQLFMWPMSLNTCQGIQHLDLSNNQIKTIPLSLATLLPNLRILNLSYNKLSNIPELPPCINELILNDNLITDIDTGLPLMCTLLNLENNALQGLPSKLPPGLLVMDISNNPDIDQLPEVLPLFMETLVIASCRISRLPEILPLNLVTLLAEHNEITSINIIWPLSIEQINLQNNQITEIPECLATCKNIRLLNLAHNPLEKRPVGNEFTFGALLNLQSLVLDNTGFTAADVPLTNHCNVMSLSEDEIPLNNESSIITIEPININTDEFNSSQAIYFTNPSIETRINKTVESAQQIAIKLRDTIGTAITWFIDPDEF
jgi:hypothetical protein